MSKNIITGNLGLNLIRATLVESGYDQVDTIDGYIIAKDSSGNHQDLIVYPVTRKLYLKGGKYESPQVLCSTSAFDALKRKANTEAGGLAPCIGFSISKYSYTDNEVIVIPIAEWNQNLHPALSITELGYYYTYTKFDPSLKFMAHMYWSGHND